MPQAFSGGADFTPLANLGKVYQEGQDRQNRLSALAQLGNDPNQNALTLIQSGDPTLAQAGLTMQGQQADRAERQREWEAGNTRAQAIEARAAARDQEDSAEGRTQKLVAANLNPNDPAYQVYVATGAQPPSVIQQAAETRAQQEEGRAKIKFDEAQQSATPQNRYNTVQEGIKSGVYPADAMQDPKIQGWIRFGDPNSGRQGLGTPIPVRNEQTGKIDYYQPNSSGPPTKMDFGPGAAPLGPGEVAQQKREGTEVGKARAAAMTALPRISDQVGINLSSLDKLENHPGRDQATGQIKGQLKDDNILLGQQGINFRTLFNHVKSQSFLSAFDTLRGAGAISDAEGKAATAAVNRLSTITDAAEFNDAVREVRNYYDLGLKRARNAAKGDFSEHPVDLQPREAPPATASGVTASATAPATAPAQSSGPVSWDSYFGKK
jgi:hypothetical protein